MAKIKKTNYTKTTSPEGIVITTATSVDANKQKDKNDTLFITNSSVITVDGRRNLFARLSNCNIVSGYYYETDDEDAEYTSSAQAITHGQFDLTLGEFTFSESHRVEGKTFRATREELHEFATNILTMLNNIPA